MSNVTLNSDGANWNQVQQQFKNNHGKEWWEGDPIGGGKKAPQKSAIQKDKEAYFGAVKNQYNKTMGYLNNAASQNKGTVANAYGNASQALTGQYGRGQTIVHGGYANLNNIANGNQENVYGELDQGMAGWQQQRQAGENEFNQLLGQQQSDMLGATQDRLGLFREQISPYKTELLDWYDQTGQKLEGQTESIKGEMKSFWEGKEAERREAIDKTKNLNLSEMDRYMTTREGRVDDARGRMEGLLGAEEARRAGIFDVNDKNINDTFAARMSTADNMELALKKQGADRNNLLANSHMYKDGSWGANSTQYVDPETKARDTEALRNLEDVAKITEMKDRVLKENLDYQGAANGQRIDKGALTEQRVAFESWANQDLSESDRFFSETVTKIFDNALSQESEFAKLSAEGQDSIIRSMGKNLTDWQQNVGTNYGDFLKNVAFKDSEWQNGLSKRFLDTMTTLNGIQSSYAENMDKAHLDLLERVIDKKIDAQNKKADSLTKAEEWKAIQLLDLEQALASGLVSNEHWKADQLIAISQWEAEQKSNAEGIITAGLDQIWNMHMDHKNMMINLAQLYS